VRTFLISLSRVVFTPKANPVADNGPNRGVMCRKRDSQKMIVAVTRSTGP
jgi:hypothetical protein